MRVVSVTAHAFGPLSEQTLGFGPGLNLVVGPNESGKSAWHAAILAGLCGRRRRKGAPGRDEARFAERHHPWDGEEWAVSAQIVLDDGRRVELHHDLAGRGACRATDLDIGRDVSAEVMNEGSPDASLWLGLGRTAFGATACISQADMLGVRASKAGLQERIQSAATTAAADTTAAGAIERIDAYLRDNVGLDRANATKPLRQAVERRDRARAELAARRQAHAEHERVASELEALREEERRAAELLLVEEAAAARAEAERLAARARRASELEALRRQSGGGARRRDRTAPGLLVAGGVAALAVGAGLLAARQGAAGGALLAAGAVALALGARAHAGAPARERLADQDRRLAGAVLDGLSAGELQAAAARAAKRAELLEAQAPGPAPGAGGLDEAQLVSLGEQVSRLREQAGRLQGRLEERAARIGSVAEAEEELLAAESELARVEELRDTLELTRSFLQRAQLSVHREVAPPLAAAVRRRLPELTRGRYADATVDPTTLQVEVCGPGRAWRRADLLSLGTAEQIYLLLRIALVEHLGAGHDTCPLLLDDVTVHADSARKAAMLELISSVAAERQVILFSQEDAVAEWARSRPGGAELALIELAPASAV